MKKLILSLLMVFAGFTSFAQILTPVKWTFTTKPAGPDHAVIVLTATIDKGWHLYSQFIAEGGPVPTSFKFTPASGYELVGKVAEKTVPHKGYDKNFSMNIVYFENKAVFEQKVKLKSPKAKVAGTVEFMVCDDHQCLPPDEVPFTVNVAKSAAKK